MNELKKVIEELILVFNELISIGNIKLNASRNQQVSAVEECVNKEQSIVLKLRGLEMKRENELEKLGFKGDSYRVILEKLSEKDKEIMEPIFNNFNTSVQTFKAINDDCMLSLKLNLRGIGKELARREGVVYSPNSNGRNLDTCLTDNKV